MANVQNCPKCGEAVPASAAEGLCSACLVLGALNPHHSNPPEFFSADSQVLVARGRLTPEGLLPLLKWDLNAPTNPPSTTLLPLRSGKSFERSAAAPDGHVYAVSQLGVKGISLWDPLTGQAVGRLHDPSLPWGMGEPWRFSPDGRKLISFGWPDNFWLSDLASPDRVAAAQRSGVRVFELAFSPDGTLVALACIDQTIRLWDTATFKELALLSGHQGAVSEVAFSPDSRTLASCGVGVKLWCLAARREVATLIRSATAFNHVTFTPDGKTLLAGDWAGRVHLWRAPTLAEIDRQPPNR